MVAAQNALPQSMLGTISGATQFFEEIGAIIGVTLVGALVTGRLTSELAARLPADLAAHADPTQLLSEEASTGLLAEVGEAGFMQILAALPEALAVAITSNFWLSVGVGLVAFFAVLTLREKRLRTGEHDLPEVPEGALGQPQSATSNGTNGNGALASGWTSNPAPVARIRPQRSLAGSDDSRPRF